VRAAIYTRVSSIEQVDEGYSLDEQERRCRKFIDDQCDDGWIYVGTFKEEGKSGTLKHRPKLDRLVASLGEVDVVVINSLDRLGRSTKNLLELYDRFEEAEVGLVFLRERLDTTTPVGRLLRTVLSAIAEFERDLIAERTGSSLAARARNGGHTGGAAPYGYRWEDRALVVEPTEANAVRRIFRDYCNGMGQRAIVRALNDDRVPTREGGEWHQSNVTKILNSVVYIGQLAFKGEVYPGAHEAIIEEDTWQRAEQIRTDVHRRKGGRHPAGAHLLTRGLLKCSSCGAAMIPRKGRPGVERERYVCSGRIADPTSCSQPSIRRELIDEPFLAHLLSGYVDLDATMKRIEERMASALTAAREAVAQAEVEVGRVERALAVTERDYDKGDIDGRQYAKREARLTEELEGARNALQRAKEQAQRVELAGPVGDAEQVLLDHLAALKKAVAAGAGAAPDFDALRNVIGQMFESVQLVRTGGWPPERDADKCNSGRVGRVGFVPFEGDVPALPVVESDERYWLLLTLKWSAVDRETFTPKRRELSLNQPDKQPQDPSGNRNPTGSSRGTAGGNPRRSRTVPPLRSRW